MPITLIQQKPDFNRLKIDGVRKFSIAEMFMDTIQGEGIYSGHPAMFIRLQGCTLACKWCDTLDVWPRGNDYSFDELFDMFDQHEVAKRLYQGHHLIWTGGSPLKQQDSIIKFTQEFVDRYSFKPFFEIENEAVLEPKPEMLSIIDCWNNSPKLSNSGMKENIRIKPNVLECMHDAGNVWWKFVISSEADWEEIKRDFLPHINKDRVILMPCGQTREELEKTREMTIDLAIKHNVTYSDRMHVVAWNKKTGV